MIHSYACRAVIEEFEGCELYRYKDGNGFWTIGVGHLIRPGEDFVEPITEERVDQLLAQDISAAETTVNLNVIGRVTLTQNQFDALVSFVFNIGPGITGQRDGFVRLRSGNPSTLLRLLRAGDFEGAAEEFPKWIHAGGKPCAGLLRRRERERALFEGTWTPPTRQ